MTAGGAVMEGGAGDAGTSSASADPLARIVFALLVVACFAAFFVTQRLKHTPTAVQLFKMTPRFSPTRSGHDKQEAISFKLAQADEVTVAIIDARGNVVATLVRDRPVPRYKQFSLRWNGRRGTARDYRDLSTPAGHTIVVPDNRGALAPAG
ncbi:MAG TPA: hypothetical protein VES97_03810, partial [Solirubrobacteraceae bacterium]|nr:hypothetical protein [Solirubrobacteraceae bacterium]